MKLRSSLFLGLVLLTAPQLSPNAAAIQKAPSPLEDFLQGDPCFGWAMFGGPVFVTLPFRNELAGYAGGEDGGNYGLFVLAASDENRVNPWWIYAVAGFTVGTCYAIPPIINGLDCHLERILESAEELIDDVSNGNVPADELPERVLKLTEPCRPV